MDGKGNQNDSRGTIIEGFSTALFEVARLAAQRINEAYGFLPSIEFMGKKAVLHDNGRNQIAVFVAREAYFVSGSATNYYYSALEGNVAGINERFDSLAQVPFRNSQDIMSALGDIVNFSGHVWKTQGNEAIIKDPHGEVLASIKKGMTIEETEYFVTQQMIVARSNLIGGMKILSEEEMSGLHVLRGAEIEMTKYRDFVTGRTGGTVPKISPMANRRTG